MASTHSEQLGESAELHMVNADPQAGAGLAAPVGSIAFMEVAPGGIFQKVAAGDTAWAKLLPNQILADPGDGLAIPVLMSGSCALTSAGAETRTLAIPAFEGQTMTLICDTFVGNIATTVASAIDSAANTIITMTAAGQSIKLEAATVGGVLFWRVVGNNGCNLT